MSLAAIQKKLKEARVSNRGADLEAGRGEFVIHRLWINDDKTSVIVRGHLEAVTPKPGAVRDLKEGDPLVMGTNTSGQTVGHVFALVHRPALADMKAFLCAALHASEEELDANDGLLDSIMGPDQPLRGMKVNYDSRTKITKTKRVPINVFTWSRGDTDADESALEARVAARRAEVDLIDPLPS